MCYCPHALFPSCKQHWYTHFSTTIHLDEVLVSALYLPDSQKGLLAFSLVVEAELTSFLSLQRHIGSNLQFIDGDIRTQFPDGDEPLVGQYGVPPFDAQPDTDRQQELL